MTVLTWPLFEVTEVVHSVKRAKVHRGNRGCILEAHSIRNDIATMDGYANTVGVCTSFEHVDTVANLELGDTGSDTLDNAGTLETNVVLVVRHDAHGDSDILKDNANRHSLNFDEISRKRHDFRLSLTSHEAV